MSGLLALTLASRRVSMRSKPGRAYGGNARRRSGHLQLERTLGMTPQEVTDVAHCLPSL